MVFIKKTRTVVSYKEYKKRDWINSLLDDDDFEFEFLNVVDKDL